MKNMYMHSNSTLFYSQSGKNDNNLALRHTISKEISKNCVKGMGAVANQLVKKISSISR